MQTFYEVCLFMILKIDCPAHHGWAINIHWMRELTAWYWLSHLTLLNRQRVGSYSVHLGYQMTPKKMTQLTGLCLQTCMVGGVPCALRQTASLVQCLLHQLRDTLPSLSCGCKLFPHPASAYMESKSLLSSKDDRSTCVSWHMPPTSTCWRCTPLSHLTINWQLPTAFKPLTILSLLNK